MTIQGECEVQILLVNPNTSHSITDSIAESAARFATPGTTILAVEPFFGPESIDSNFESYLSAVAVMDRILAVDEPYDAVILAGFGEHGREGVQELVSVPVLDIAECAASVAQFVGRMYSVITTLDRSVPAIEDRLRLAGLFGRCASVRSIGMSTAESDAYVDMTFKALVREGRIAVEQDKAEVLCLGCSGMTGLEVALSAELGVPVIDGVGAAVKLAEALTGLGLQTSKVRTYATPERRAIRGWPIHRGGALQ